MAITGVSYDCTGATIKVNNTELMGGLVKSLSLKELSQDREGLYTGNYPDPQIVQIRKWIEGSVEFDLDRNASWIPNSTTNVTLDIVVPSGLTFNASVRVKDPEVKLETGEGNTLNGSFSFVSGSTYTLTL
jgi:hypothetical protein